jgi:hypothetical protein
VQSCARKPELEAPATITTSGLFSFRNDSNWLRTLRGGVIVFRSSPPPRLTVLAISGLSAKKDECCGMTTLSLVAFAIAVASFIVGGTLYAFVICRTLSVSYWESIDAFKQLKDFRNLNSNNKLAMLVHNVTYIAMVLQFLSIAVMFLSLIIGVG